MTSGYWKQVRLSGFRLPQDRRLDDLTAELTTMLGSSDPAARDGIAYPAFSTWIGDGVYDDLLAGLGDGMAAGLAVGLGESGTDTVFRRSFSVLVLAQCLQRTRAVHLLPGSKVLEWGDRIATWYLREQDTRGFVDDMGWAHAIAHGADALGELAESPHLAAAELTVVLDVIADRLLVADQASLSSGEPDRMAMATMSVLRRNVVSLNVIEPWITRIAQRALAFGDADTDPYATSVNPQAFLRALYLQLSLAADPPRARPDLILVLIEALRATNPDYLAVAMQDA